MKKIYLIVGLLLLISINLIADDIMRPELITLDQFANEYIPDYTLQKRIPLEGKGRAYAIAKESGDIVAITETDNKFVIKFFDVNGDMKWKKEMEKARDCYIDCEISDNGETICIYTPPTYFMKLGKNAQVKPTGCYITKSTIFSREGNLLFSKDIELTRLIPSPTGKYLYKSTCGYNKNQYKNLDIYNKEGNLINVTGFNYYANILNVKFLDKNHILTYIMNEEISKLIMFNFDGKLLQKQWEYEIPSENSLSERFSKKVIVSDDKFAVFGGFFPDDIWFYVFDFSGNLLYLADNKKYYSDYTSFGFLDDRIYFQNNRLKDDRFTVIIDLKTKNIQIKDYSFWDLNIFQGKHPRFNNPYMFNDSWFFNIQSYGNKEYYFDTLILDNKNLENGKYLHHSVNMVKTKSKSSFILTKYGEESEIIIMEGGMTYEK